MYLINRMRHFNGGDVKKTMGACVEVAAAATEVSGIPISVWTVNYHPFGAAVAWSARLESIAEYEAMTAKLGDSEDFLKLSEKVAKRMPGHATVDSLHQIVAGSLPETPAEYVALTQARAANSRRHEAAIWGAELAAAASKSLDVATAFAVGVYGAYGTMSWITAHPDAKSLDDTRTKMVADEALAAQMDAGGDLVQPDATQVLMRRIN